MNLRKPSLLAAGCAALLLVGIAVPAAAQLLSSETSAEADVPGATTPAVPGRNIHTNATQVSTPPVPVDRKCAEIVCVGPTGVPSIPIGVVPGVDEDVPGVPSQSLPARHATARANASAGDTESVGPIDRTVTTPPAGPVPPISVPVTACPDKCATPAAPEAEADVDVEPAPA